MKTVQEAIAMLATGDVTEASLDHDLTFQAYLGNWEHEPTGYDVVCWMENNQVWPPEGVHVHSQNPAGLQRMQQVIDRHYGGAR